MDTRPAAERSEAGAALGHLAGAALSDDVAILRQWLRGRDVHCPVCRYNLRDLETAVCPECAAPLHLQIASPNLEVAPWFVAAVSLSLAIGFDVVASIIALIGLVLFPAPPAVVKDTMVFSGSLTVAGAVCGGVLVLLFIRRRAWARLRSRTQWGIAATLFVLTGTTHALLGLYLAQLF